MEIIGILYSFGGNNGCLCLEIGNAKLSFKIGSKEASCILEQINDTFIGKEIALLRTDIAEKPLVLRLIT